MMATRTFARLAGGVVVVAAATGWIKGAHAQDEAALAIELNKMEDTDQGCRSSFVFDNQTGHQLDRFQLDLVLFDTDGIADKQVVLDMAPLYVDKKTLASFVFDETACDKIGSILVNAVPACENGAGNAISCVELLEVTSRSDVPLEK